MCHDISANLIADLIFSIGVLIIGSLILYLTRKKGLFTFFGLKGSRSLTVYLSTLFIPRDTAAGFDGTIRSYEGIAVLNNEQMLAGWFHGLFNFPLPSLAESYGIFRKLFVSDALIKVQASPITRSYSDVSEDRGTLVSVGSHGYNSITSWMQNHLVIRTKFADDGNSMSIDGITVIHDGSNGVIEKHIDANGRTYFLVGGISEIATLSALYLLISKWKVLRSKHGMKPFVQLIRAGNRGWADATFVN